MREQRTTKVGMVVDNKHKNNEVDTTPTSNHIGTSSVI